MHDHPYPLVSNADLMARAARSLRERADDAAALRALLGPPPEGFEIPAFNTPAYVFALRCGWITPEDEQADRVAWEQRRLKSLQTCHRYSLYERPRAPAPKDTGAYVPELSARLEDDPNLTDGARRCARKLAEYTYRHARATRSSEITVTWLMQALGKCRRSVQRYLRILEREGYIRVDVIHCRATRMCAGLLVHLENLLLPRHHRNKWPANLAIPDATAESHKKSLIKYKGPRGAEIPRHRWAIRCMDGVFRSLTKTLPLFSAPLTVSA